MVVCMFARIDDEIMRCKSRLVFLTKFEVSGPGKEYPVLTWDADNLTAEYEGKSYLKICENVGDEEVNEDTRITIKNCRPTHFTLEKTKPEEGISISFFILGSEKTYTLLPS